MQTSNINTQKTVKVQSVEIDTLPLIYATVRGQNGSLLTIFIDTGSQANICSLQTLLAMGFTKNQIGPSGNYNIKSSRHLVKNAIIGQISLQLSILLHSTNDIGEFGKTKKKNGRRPEPNTFGTCYFGDPMVK